MSVLSPAERAKIGIQGWSEANRMKKCWLFHRWGKWKTVQQGNITRMDDSIIGRIKMQERSCERCNKLQGQSIRWSINS